MPTRTRKKNSVKKRHSPTNKAAATNPVNKPGFGTTVPDEPARISISVRRLVIQRPEITFSEITDALINLGWERPEIIRRWSTITTLRSDALAILNLARKHGWVMRGKTGRAR
jgi:hypothetical protein